MIRRIGVNIVDYEHFAVNAHKLPVGWYKDFGHWGRPFIKNGREVGYVPILLYRSKDDSATKKTLTWILWHLGKIPRHPGVVSADLLEAGSLPRLRKAIECDIESFPEKTLFLVGIEPGYSDNSDDRTPDQVLHDSKLLKELLDSFDRGYQLGLGGMSTNRNEHAKHAYGGRYAIDYFREILDLLGDFAFDAFVIHPYPFPDATKRPMFEDARDQIIEFRQVMAEHGLRSTPLLVGEVGVPLPLVEPRDVQEFAGRIIEFLLSARDIGIGNPDDDDRLVQRFCWFSFAPPPGPIAGWTDNPGLDFAASALVSTNGDVTPLGHVFSAAVNKVIAGEKADGRNTFNLRYR